jgi:hypothetical protein
MKDFYKEAREFHEKNKYQEAINLYRQGSKMRQIGDQNGKSDFEQMG